MTSNVTISAAAVAGLLSFLSPCVLPLVPPYLTFIAGTGLEELVEGGERRARRDIADRGRSVRRRLFHGFRRARRHRLGGRPDRARSICRCCRRSPASPSSPWACTFSACSGFSLLYREKRVSVEKPVGLWGAYVHGPRLRSSAGRPASGRSSPPSSPCGLRRRRSARAPALLAVYSLGLGMPFMLAALAMEPFIHFMRRFKRHFGKVERVVGVLLVVDRRAVPDRRLPERQFLAVADFSGSGQAGLNDSLPPFIGRENVPRPFQAGREPSLASLHLGRLWLVRLTWRLAPCAAPSSRVTGETAPLAAIAEACLESAR